MGSEMLAIETMTHEGKLAVRRIFFCAARLVLSAGLLIAACSSAQADSERGKRIYRENCAPCHGESGKGDGAGARSLPVRPADHTDGKMMSSRTDAFLRDVIAKGGSATGLSSFMPAWQGILKENEIQDLIDYIRNLPQVAK
jgi:mono/diheme cytochrome c family protein